MDSRHKDILFLVSLSPDIIFNLKNKNFDYSYFLNQIKSINNVDFRESISKDDLAIANQYKIVIVVGHRKGDFLELSDRSLFPLGDIVASLPTDFAGVIDVSVCDSTVIHDALKMHCPRAIVQTANEKTGIDFRLPLYSILLNRLPVNINYRDAYLLLLERMEAKQNLIPKQELKNRQTTTKLGTESKDDIRSSIFMPKKVARGEFFKLQIIMHLDVDTGTLYFEEARGNDPNTAQRKKNVAIKDINKGDELLLNLCFLDAEDRALIPAELINVQELIRENDYYMKRITISEKDQTLVLHVKIANEYTYSKFFTIIKFLKEDKLLIEPFDLETEFKVEEKTEGDSPQNTEKDRQDKSHETVKRRLSELPRADANNKQIEELRKELKIQNRESKLNQLLELVDKGDWIRDDIAGEVKLMLKTILGQGITPLKDDELEMSENLWSLLEEGKGNRVKVIWQNLVGFLDEKHLFREKGSPALNIDFFGTMKGYTNIDKGRPQNEMSRGFSSILKLLYTYCPR